MADLIAISKEEWTDLIKSKQLIPTHGYNKPFPHGRIFWGYNNMVLIPKYKEESITVVAKEETVIKYTLLGDNNVLRIHGGLEVNTWVPVYDNAYGNLYEHNNESKEG